MSKLVLTKQAIPPDSPTSNQVAIYVESDGFLRTKDDAGTVTNYGAAAGDHGGLTGLADDDHPQYLLADGSRPMTGPLDLGGQAITSVGNVDGRDVGADGATLDAVVPIATAAASAISGHIGAGGATQHPDAVASGASGFMTGADKAKLDGIASGATATPLSSTTPEDVGSAAVGAATTAARADHVHAHGDQAGGSLHAAATTVDAGFMSAADKSKLDGVAAGATATPLASTLPAAVGTAAVGVATTAARADHVHTHGNQGGGALHATAVASGDAGFMSGADKAKLDGVEPGADVTDATNVAAAGAIMDGDFAGSYPADMGRTGAGAYAPTKRNLSAITAPTTGDDSSLDYSVGSRWINTTTGRVYVCVDASVGAAVWRETSVVAAALEAAGGVLLGGQIGGTSASPDVRGLRETSGPTLLTLGAIADGHLVARAGNDLVGVPVPSGGSLFRGVRGFSLTNYLERATAGDLAGNATPGFEIYAILNVDDIRRGLLAFSSYIASTGNEFVGPGYHLWVEGDRPRHTISDGTGSFLSNFLQQWILDAVYKKPLIPISLGFNGSTRFLKIAGQSLFSAAMTGYTASANPFRVGRPGGSASAGGFSNGTLFALAAKTDGVLTDSQHEEIFRTFLATGDLPNSAFTSRWSFASLSVGAVPSTVPDAIGSNDLTLVGSLSVVDDKFSGLALVGDPASTSVKIGGQIGGTVATPDVRGIRETAGPTLLTIGAIPDGSFPRRSGATIVGGAPVSTTSFMRGFGSHPSDATQRAAWALSSDPLDAQTAWTVFWVHARLTEPQNDEVVWSTSNQFCSDGGARGRLTDTAFSNDFVDSTPGFVTGASSGEDRYRRQVRMVVQVFNSGSLLGYVDGYYANALASGAAGAYNSSGRNLHIGADAEGAVADQATGAGGIQSHALAFWGFALRAVTQDQIREWFRACLLAGGFADIPSGGGLTRAFRAADANLGAGTWAPFIGSGGATKVGTKTLSLTSLPMDW